MQLAPLSARHACLPHQRHPRSLTLPNPRRTTHPPWPRSPLPTPGKAAVARVLRLEAAAGAQAEQLAALGGQLDKLSIRSRVVGRDIKLPLQQVRHLWRDQ